MRAIHPHGVGTPPDASTPTAGPAPPPWACRTASAAIYHARHGTVAVSEPLQPASRLNGVAPVRTTRIRRGAHVAAWRVFRLYAMGANAARHQVT